MEFTFMHHLQGPGGGGGRDQASTTTDIQRVNMSVGLFREEAEDRQRVKIRVESFREESEERQSVTMSAESFQEESEERWRGRTRWSMQLRSVRARARKEAKIQEKGREEKLLKVRRLCKSRTPGAPTKSERERIISYCSCPVSVQA